MDSRRARYTVAAMPAIELLYQAAIEHTVPRMLIINAHRHALLSTLSEHSLQLDQGPGQLDLHQHFKPGHESLRNQGLQPAPSLPEYSNYYDSILLLPSKHKQQTYAWMAEAMRMLRHDGTLIMACANTHGAKSYASAMQRLAGNMVCRSKSKCRIFSASKTSVLDLDLCQQWCDAARPQRITRHGLIAHPGLFSWDHADIGSQLLIDHLPDNFTGRGMDLCCGYGLLSEHLLRTVPGIDTLHLLEADRLALDCAIQNTLSWQEKTSPHWLDAAQDALPDKLDWIVCNPPFHTGQQRDVELGKTIVKRGCQSLKRGGTIYVVANRKLAYEALMRTELKQCQTVIEANGFKVIKGIR